MPRLQRQAANKIDGRLSFVATKHLAGPRETFVKFHPIFTKKSKRGIEYFGRARFRQIKFESVLADKPLEYESLINQNSKILKLRPIQ